MIRALVASTILIPILYLGPGRFGTHWVTNVFITNTSPRALDGHGITFTTFCPIPEGCPQPTLEPGQFARIEGPLSSRGLLLHVPESMVELVDLQAHFGETSRRSVFSQVQLPIARENDFRTTRLALPVVRVSGDSRTLLRIYSPDPLTDQQVRVTLRPWYAPDSSPLAERVVTLEAPKTPTEFPLTPAFAELVLQRDFSGIPDIVRIELEPQPRLDGRIPRIWGFVTATHNATQEVLVISPL